MKELVFKNLSLKVMIILTAMVLVVSSSLVFLAEPVAAQADLACKGAGGVFDPATGACNTTGANLVGAGGLIQRVVNILLFGAGAIAVIMIIVGGIRYVISQGDQNNVTAAKNTILYAVIGLVVAVLAYALVGFITGGLSSGSTPPPAQQTQQSPAQQTLQPPGSVTQP